MGFCRVLFALLSSRLSGYQLWSRKRSVISPSRSLFVRRIRPFYVFSFRLVPRNDLHCRSANMVRNLHRAYSFWSNMGLEYPIFTMRPPSRQTYIRFRAGWRAQGLDRNLLPYRSPLQPYAAWYALIMIVVILILSGFSVFLRDNWDTATFVTNYLPLMLAPFLFIGATLVMKSKFIKVEDMDFITGLDQVIADTYEEPPPKTIWEKFWRWIVSAPISLTVPPGVSCITHPYLQF